MPDEKTQAAAATTATQTPPQGSAHSQSTAAAQPKSAIPAEYAGKSAEEIYSALTDRYKDYDTVKERAALADRFDSLKVTPENVEQTRKWITDMMGGLSSGKQAMFNRETGQIVWVDAQGKQTTAPSPAEQQDIFADWETLDGRTQGQRLAQHTEQALNSRVNQVVEHYNREFTQALQRLEQRNNLFVDVLERWIENPNLKPKDLLAKVAELQSGANPVELAARELGTPAQIQQQIQEGIAQGIAAFKQQWEAEHSAPNLAPSMGMRPHGVKDGQGKPVGLAELRNRVIGSWHQNGMTR